MEPNQLTEIQTPSTSGRWLSIEQASQLSGRSQIAMRALIQTTLEDPSKRHLLKPASQEQVGDPFSYLIHEQLIISEYGVQTMPQQRHSAHEPTAVQQPVVAATPPPTEVQAGTIVSSVSSETQDQLARLYQQLSVQKQTIESLSAENYELKRRVATTNSVQSIPQQAKTIPALPVPPKATIQPATDWLNSASDSNPESTQKKESLTGLWLTLGAVLLIGLGALGFLAFRAGLIAF